MDPTVETVLTALALILSVVGMFRLALKRYVPAMEVLADQFGAEDDVFGAAFVSFGNALDVFFITSLSASFEQYYHTGPAVVFGGCLWNVCITVPLIAFMGGGPTALSAIPVLRDCGFQVIAIGWLIFLFSAHGSVNFFLALGLLLVYVTYIGVLGVSAITQRTASQNARAKMSEEDVEAEKEALIHSELPPDPAAGTFLEYVFLPFDWFHTTFLPNPFTYPFTCVVLALPLVGLYNCVIVVCVGMLEDELGLASGFLGLFLVGACTEIPDMLSASLLSKNGRGVMAFSAAMGANVCASTLSLSMPWITAALLGEPVEIENEGLLVSLMVWMGALVVLVTSLRISGWVFTRTHANVLVGLYILYLISQMILLGTGEMWVDESKMKLVHLF